MTNTETSMTQAAEMRALIRENPAGWEALAARTWPQLRECTLVAMTALAQITAEGADDRQQVRVAADALATMGRILAEGSTTL